MAQIVNNESTLENLMDTLEKYQQAKRDHDQAREAYTGYSWGYAGASYIEARDNTRTVFGETLEEYVDTKVRAVVRDIEKEKEKEEYWHNREWS